MARQKPASRKPNAKTVDLLAHLPPIEDGVPIAYGYARVSTDRQETGSDAQRRALEGAGCMAIVEEQASGRKARPALAALVNRLRPGDTLTVFRFDRISRSVADFYAIGKTIEAKGASLHSIKEQFDTSTPTGRAMMGLAAVFAQLEADTISERVNNGIAAAKQRGQHFGPRPKLSVEAEERIIAALEAGEEKKPLARAYGVSAKTIRRIELRHDAAGAR